MDILPIKNTSGNNPLFDFKLTNLINRLKQNNMDIKTVKEIQENTIFFSGSSMVTYIVNVIDCICNMKDAINSIQLFLEAFEVYYKMRIIVDYLVKKELNIKHLPKLTNQVMRQHKKR